MVCPACIHISKALRPGYAVQNEMCPCCGSESLVINLVPVQDYLQENTLDKLQERLNKTMELGNISADWKKIMCSGIEKLIELKNCQLQDKKDFLR